MAFALSDLTNFFTDPITGRPYKDAAAANNAAGDKLEALGDKTHDMSEQGISRALDQTTPAARNWHNTYEGEGGLAGPGQLEDYYKQRMAGTSPDQIRSRELGAKSISDAFAARGLNNSGAALKAVGNLNADLGAAEEKQMGLLAAGAQGAEDTRLGGAFDRINSLGQGRANTVMGGTDSGVSNYIAGQTGGINARLGAAQNKLDASKDRYKLFGSLAGAFG